MVIFCQPILYSLGYHLLTPNLFTVKLLQITHKATMENIFGPIKKCKSFLILGATNWKKLPEVPTISQKRSSLDVNSSSLQQQRHIIIPDIKTKQVS